MRPHDESTALGGDVHSLVQDCAIEQNDPNPVLIEAGFMGLQMLSFELNPPVAGSL
jgi:hypothetical protein